jgi:hypothetical protein
MNYDKIRNILEKNKFLAHTVKRNGSRLTYSYFSVPYYAVKIDVEVIKVNPETFGMTKMVSEIVVNEKKIEDFKEFIATLSSLHKIHNKERVKLFKQKH